MITDKEKLDAPYMPSALLCDIRKRKDGHWCWSNKRALDKIYERDRFIRTEAAEQARKEAADRICASCPGKEDGMCGECSDRATILNLPAELNKSSSKEAEPDNHWTVEAAILAASDRLGEAIEELDKGR